MSTSRNRRRRRNPASAVARADQLGAARRETSAIVDGMAARWSCQPTPVLNRWAVRFAVDRSARLAAGDPALATCGHTSAPAALLMPTWTPVVVCAACVDLIPLADGEEDRRCDGCGAVVGQIHPTAMATSTAIVLGGLCGWCMAATKVGAA